MSGSSGELPDILIAPVIAASLAEDLGRSGDITSLACIDVEARLTCAFVARKAGIIAGLACARLAMTALDPDARIEIYVADGDRVRAGERLAVVEAGARAVLSAERTALNLLGHLSGVATLTRAYVDAVAGTAARIIDTRKTTPGLRALEKYAVRLGGGANHRFGLDDAILIKDNHVAACGGPAPTPVTWSRSRLRWIALANCARPSRGARTSSCWITLRCPTFAKPWPSSAAE